MLKKFCYISIFSWQKLIATLDDRHLHTKPLECLREFAANGAAAKHDQAFRFFLQLVEDCFVREIRNRVDAFHFWNRCAASRSDDKIFRVQFLTIYFDFVR